MPLHGFSRSHLPTSSRRSGSPRALTRTPCTARQVVLTSDVDDTDPDVYSLMDEYPDAFRPELDALDLLLRTLANLIEDTTQPDQDIRIASLLVELIPSVWRRHDNDRLLTEAVSAFLADEAAWLIAYASGVPGCDRQSTAAKSTLDWLDAAPRPLRAQLIRAAAARYLG